MSRRPLDRAAIALGGAGLASIVFIFTDSDIWQLVQLHGPGAIATLLFGGLATAGGWFGRTQLVLAAGVGYLAAALMQLVQFGRGTNWLEGDGSTFSFFLGLAIGLLALTLAHRSDNNPEDVAHATR